VRKTEPISAPCQPYGGVRPLIAFILIGLSLLSTPGLYSQSSKTTKSGRKLVHKVEPVYPQDLKRLNIGGTVKLDVQISARGGVEKVQIMGGNPILADSAARAVKQWQYEPAESASSILLNVEFNPRR
jgi:TonB family protein